MWLRRAKLVKMSSLKGLCLINNLKRHAVFFTRKNNIVKSVLRNYKRLTSTETPRNNSDLLFFSGSVQDLLKKLTRIDVNVVFRKQMDEKHMEDPKYKFMTTEQVQEAFKIAMKKAEEKLQMPPVVPVRKEIDYVFSNDAELQGYDTSKYIFTDISFGKTDRNRIIVVRETDGILRKAKWDERHRANYIYFSRPGLSMRVPKMFQQDFLKPILERGDYKFILDHACVQFEPDDPEYHRVVKTTYDHIDTNQKFHSLRSTRHYGPLVFYLATEGTIDNLLLENLQSDRLEDAVWLISLYHIIKPSCQSASMKYKAGDDLSFIKEYIEKDSKKSSVLNLALREYCDLHTNSAEATA